MPAAPALSATAQPRVKARLPKAIGRTKSRPTILTAAYTTVTAGHSYPVGANTGSGCRFAVAGRQAAGYTFPQISLRYLRRRVLLRVSGRMLKLSAPAFNKQRSIERPKAQVIAVIERLTGVRPNPEFITDRGTDACVICGADTEVPSQLHVNLREGYIDGVGQCCASCGSD